MKTVKKSIALLLAVIMAVCCMSIMSVAANDPFENSEWFTVGDYTLHYRMFEPKNTAKNQIMFIHGFGLSTASFEQMVPYFLDAGYRCVLVDVPDMGYSTRETANMELVDREMLIYALMESLNSDNWILAGHSMGGGIAVNIAAEHPQKIDKLLLYCPQTTAQLEYPMNKFMSSCFMRTLFDTIISVGCGSDLIMRLLVKSMLQDDECYNSYDVSSISEPLRVKGTGAGMAVMSSHAKGADYEAIKALDIPALVIEGGIDVIANKSNLLSLEAALSLKTVERIEDAGHMLIQTRAQQAAQMSIDYILF